jgi:hypothetical protein
MTKGADRAVIEHWTLKPISLLERWMSNGW